MPTFSEFEILRDAFIALGVPTVICDPRDLEFAAGSRFSAGTGRGLYAKGERIDLVYRRVLINDIVARETECRALLDGYRSRHGLRRQHAALQDPAQEGVLRRADRRALRRRCSPRTSAR